MDRINRHVCTRDTILELGTNNPVKKVLLLVIGYEGNLLIDKVPEENLTVGRVTRSFEHTTFLIKLVCFSIKITSNFILFKHFFNRLLP